MNGRIYGFLDFIVSLASEFRKCILMLTHFLPMFPFTRLFGSDIQFFDLREFTFVWWAESLLMGKDF